MKKGFSYMIEMAAVVFIFMVFAFSLIKSGRVSYPDRAEIAYEASKIMDFLEMKGLLREYSCLKRTTKLEAEMAKYLSYGFDVSICSDSCTPYQTPKHRNVVVYQRFVYGCYSTSPRLIRVYLWKK